MRVHELFLRHADDGLGRDGDAAIGVTMSGVVSALDPGLCEQVVDTDVVKPCVVEVLAADDEQTVCGDGREVGVSGAWDERFGGGRRACGEPVAGREVEEADVVEGAGLVGVLWVG